MRLCIESDDDHFEHLLLTKIQDIKLKKIY